MGGTQSVGKAARGGGTAAYRSARDPQPDASPAAPHLSTAHLPPAPPLAPPSFPNGSGRSRPSQCHLPASMWVAARRRVDVPTMAAGGREVGVEGQGGWGREGVAGCLLLHRRGGGACAVRAWPALPRRTGRALARRPVRWCKKQGYKRREERPRQTDQQPRPPSPQPSLLPATAAADCPSLPAHPPRRRCRCEFPFQRFIAPLPVSFPTPSRP